MKLPPSLTTVTTLSKTIALILFIALPFIGFYFGMQYQKNIMAPSAPTSIQPTSISNELVFEGTLQGFNDSCVVDGECSVTVSGYVIVTNPGDVMERKPIGQSDVSKNDIGKKVKVRALNLSNKKLTIVGDSGYYVLRM